MTEPRTILLASDLSARSDRATDRALQLGRQMSASVLLVHVVESMDEASSKQERARDALQAMAVDACCPTEVVIRSGEVHGEILKLTEQRSPMLIVAGPARFNSLCDFVLGTAVDHLVRQSPVPLLVVKQRSASPYRRLLVATDFSHCSRTALEVAAELFPDRNLTVWHSFHAPYEGFLEHDATAAEIREEAREAMADFLEHARIEDSVRKKLNVVISEGELHSLAARTMAGHDFDLLVLGTHGRGGFAHATIGSRAAELLQAVNRDVLLVRAKPD